jgi:hypothetical protein
MATGARKAKRRTAPITGRRSESTKPANPPTDARPLRGQKSRARSDAPVKETSRKSTRSRRTTAGRRGGGKDSGLAAQLEAIARGLQQIAVIRTEMEEMRTVLEELAQNVAALVTGSSARELATEPSESAVIEEVLIVGSDEDSGDNEEESGPSGSPQD